MTDRGTRAALDLMDDFARGTGLTPSEPPRRYLWTDAFAVCNELALHGRTADDRHLERALRLVDQVHRVLGRHRDDDSRSGWISGLDEEEGARHPTAGGLRIGKELPERGPDEPIRTGLEWERDGQYFHYLTRWMHALLRVSEVTEDREPLRWSLELARAAHRAFTERPRPGATPRMYWKMSIDLSRPQVDSMGAHDPLDGLLTYRTLQAVADADPEPLPDLRDEISEMQELCRGRSWATEDPLGIGGLLLDLHRVSVRRADENGTGGNVSPARLAEEALRSLAAYTRTDRLRSPAEHRLAFRELGLAIGLRGVEDLSRRREEGEADDWIEALARHLELGRVIEEYWLDPAHRAVRTWTEHVDINAVMLATSQVPEGWLGSSGGT